MSTTKAFPARVALPQLTQLDAVGVRPSRSSPTCVDDRLAVLRDAGLVAADRDGRVVRYRLASSRVRALVAALGAAADYR